MSAVTHPLLALHRNPAVLEHLAVAAGDEFSLHALSDWASLGEAVSEAPPSAVIVVDPCAGARRQDGPTPELRSFLAHHPSTTVFAALEVEPHWTEHLQTLARWGVAEVIALGHDDTPGALRQRFRATRGRPLKLLVADLLPDLPERTRTIVNAAAEIATVSGNADDLARRLRVSHRSLLRWTHYGGLPQPHDVLRWMQVLLAAQLLDDAGRSVESIATATGFPSVAMLRCATRSCVGLTPTELRARGACEQASRAIQCAFLKHSVRRVG